MQPTNWYRRPANRRCLYCARLFDDAVVVQKEHLIGRQFVPRGSFNNGRSWNFIFGACSECNGSKSRLEGHVGATTQLMSPGVAEDAVYAQRLSEKVQREYHPWTKRPVADSFHESAFAMQMGSIGMKTNFVGPPQLDRDQAYELALRHIQGFLALAANADHTTEHLSLLPPSAFWPLREYSRSDWGNTHLRTVHERTRHWKTYIRVITASDFFRCVMKRDDAQPKTWYWLLEWNRSTRVVGGISPDHPPQFMMNLPAFHWARMPGADGSIWRFRQEEPLRDDRDDFFDEAVEAPANAAVQG